MASMPHLDTHVSTFEVQQLVKLVWQGRIRVPAYSRRIVWGQREVIELFDSILRGYPIGTLMFSEGPGKKEVLRLGPIEVHAEAESLTYWVIDGQQRLISLASAMHEEGQTDSRFAISYAFHYGGFVPTPTSHDPLCIPLSTLFNTRSLLQWFAEFPQVSEHLEEAFAVAQTINGYQVPAYIVHDTDPAITVTIFERLNTSGKALRRSDLFTARTVAVSGEDEPRRIDLVAERIHASRGFGLVDESTIHKAILACHSADTSRNPDSWLIDWPEIYDKGEKALRRAVSFLQSQAYIPHVSFLPHRHLLIALTRFFATYPENEARDLALLVRWVWRAVDTGASFMMSANSTALRDVLSLIDGSGASESVQRLLWQINRPREVDFDIARFKKSAPQTRSMLCAWWQRAPRNIWTGEAFSLGELTECLGNQNTVDPAIRRIVRSSDIPVNLSANQLLHPSGEQPDEYIVEALTHLPMRFDAKIGRTIARSHGIDQESLSLLEAGDYQRFFEFRLSYLERDYKDFMRRACAWGLEDTPPLSSLIIDDEDDDVVD